MKTYFANGISKDMPYYMDDPEEFCLQELGANFPGKYIYSGDSINYQLDEGLSCLYDTLRDLFFEDTDEYYRDFNIIPIWVIDAGQNSDSPISAKEFNELLESFGEAVPNINKHLYLSDCRFLVGTVQNLLSSMEDSFIKYYISLTALDDSDYKYNELQGVDGVCYVMSAKARSTVSLIETYFTKAHSVLDILCKICFEIQNKNEDFSRYKKIKSAKILWGDRKKLAVNNTVDTLFERCELTDMIESLRNEVVHNGAWELNPKVFVRIENKVVEERYVLFPDMSDGHLASVHGRRHFFSENLKVNYILPRIHTEFKQRLINTLELLNGRVEKHEENIYAE